MNHWNEHEIEISDEDYNVLDLEYNFLLDVAATEGNTKCPNFFTKKEDGLGQRWDVFDVKRGYVWCFPPQLPTVVPFWANKALKECEENNVNSIVYIRSTFLKEAWLFELASKINIKIVKGKMKFNIPKGRSDSGKMLFEHITEEDPMCLLSFRPRPALRGFILLEDIYED